MRSFIEIQYRTVKEEWRRFIFGGDSVSSTIPLTFGTGSSSSGKRSGPTATIPMTTDNDKIFSTGFDVTTIDDMGPQMFSEVEADLELRNTNTRLSQDV